MYRTCVRHEQPQCVRVREAATLPMLRSMHRQRTTVPYECGVCGDGGGGGSALESLDCVSIWARRSRVTVRFQCKSALQNFHDCSSVSTFAMRVCEGVE